MLPVQASAQDAENVKVALVFIAAGIMIFWRYLLRILLAIFVAAAGVGAVVMLQSMHH